MIEYSRRIYFLTFPFMYGIPLWAIVFWYYQQLYVLVMLIGINSDMPFCFGKEILLIIHSPNIEECPMSI